MDALALLCTLHAEGPRTTRRLRHLGVHSLDALGQLPPEELAEALESGLPMARRFLREAAVLSERLRREGFEEEDVRPEPRRRVAAEPPEAPGAGALAAALWSGLDAATSRALASAGIGSMEQLARASALDLAIELKWPYDRIFRLKKEACRRLEALGAAGAAGAPIPRMPSEEGAAGPFA